MEPYRPLRLILFIYDFIRLIVMTRVPDTGGLFPYVFYAVPNGLFTLMSFFLWFRLDAYKPYIPLYLAGKILAVIAVLSWMIFSLSQLANDLLIGTVLLLSAGDALTVIGSALLKKRIRRVEEERTGCV
jgi:hypothetical protein